MRAPRLALIGCGAAATPYLQALRQLRLRPAVFVDADIAAARALAKGAAVAATPAAVLDRFDAAIVTGIGAGIATALHELTSAAKPVLCAPEAQAAARAGPFPATTDPGSRSFAGSHLRFASSAQRVWSLVNAGALGSLLSFDVRLGAPPPAAAQSPDYWDRTIAGGGVLTDPGVHLLDLLGWWLGPLTPQGLEDDSQGGVEAEVIARVSTAGGASGVVELSRLRALRNSVALNGSKGRVELDLETLTLRAEPRDLLDDIEPRTRYGSRARALPEALHRLRIERWLDASTVGRDSVPDLLASANAMEVLIALYASRQRLVHGWERPGPRSPTIASGASALAGCAVLVAGATGFIGARLVEMLAANEARVTAAVRNLKRAARIARFDVRLARIDLGSTAQVEELTRGQDAVFSLAYDVKRSGADNFAAYLSLADACVRNGVRRFIHVSSIAVYDDWPAGELDEQSPRDASGSEYKIAKRAMEVDLGQRTAAGVLSATILQPTIVYGPFSALWTDRFVERLLAGTVELPRNGLGHCCGVYVDDVVRALLAAAVRTGAGGESYIVSGPRVFDWAALIGGYAHALGRTLASSDAPIAPVPARAPSLLRVARNDPLAIARWRPVRAVLALIRERLGEEAVQRLRERVVALRRRAGPLIYRPVDEDPCLYLSRGACSIAKARRELNFTPAVELEEGLRRTRDYIRWRYMGAAADADER